ncbi:Unknown protein [Striga hermonthica]|uniref:DUF1985 domain-containing protein n=1 Tax=Striga hermonthica TaxID=68872 RepID=A0A9N7RAD3_STRHE|nr:Unknown protein [Striga hermonthica]
MELALPVNIVHQVLRRTLKASENDKDAVWFRFGEKEARFGSQEFCLVTGFKIVEDDENAYEVPRNNSSHLQLFKEKQGKIKRSDIIEKFHELDNEKDAELKYKMGLVTVLEHVVLSAECETLVNERWFYLVEDLERFNSYPWGNLSYQQTVKLFQRTSFGKEKNPKSIKYSLHGFSLAILIWAFEALPDLGREFAEKRNDLQFLRMYCWKMEKQLRGDQLNTFFDRAEVAEEEDSVRPDEDEECTATKVQEEGSSSSKVDDDDDEDEEEEEEEKCVST